MHVVVLLKMTFDTEEKVVLRDGVIEEDGVKFIINPYDEYAVEEAIRIKEQNGAKVTVVSIGSARVTEVLRTALAMGADEAVLIDSEGIVGARTADEGIANEGSGVDEAAISKVLAAYLRQVDADILLGGFFSVDNGGGQVAIRVAHLLGIPHVSAITGLTLQEGNPGESGSTGQSAGIRATVIRDSEGDSETIEVALPALFTAQQGLNEPRYPSLPGIMKAKKKPLTTMTLEDLGLTNATVDARVERTGIALPPARQAGQKLSGTPAEAAAKVAQVLAGVVKGS